MMFYIVIIYAAHNFLLLTKVHAMSVTMQLIINGKPRSFDAENFTVAQLVVSLNLEGK